MDSKSSGKKNTTACTSARNVRQSSPDIERGKSSSRRLESQKSSLPPPQQDPVKEQTDTHRLWIGNVDTRITEFTLLKLLQKFGQLEKFDFLYHKSGPDQGKPRGYCFATYNTKQEAEAAKRGLNGKLALSKRLLVKNAHVDGKEAAGKPQTVPNQSGQNLDRESQIRALEAKLQMMQEGKQDAPCAGSAPSVVEAINSQKASTLPVPSSNRSSKDRQSYRGQSRNYSGSSRPNRTKPYGGRSSR